MMRFPKSVSLACLLAFWSGAAWAQAQCDAALVRSTYRSWDESHVDWRLATMVTRDEYDAIKHEAKANATIYGIPMGASYDDFTNRVEQEMQSHHESITTDQAKNIMWTGLDPNSPSVYAQCIAAFLSTTRGLHMTVRTATHGDISLTVGWNPRGNDPSSIKVTWSPPSLGGVTLPRSVTAGTLIVIVPRPTDQQQIAVNYPGFADSTVLEPLPPTPPPLSTVVKPFSFDLMVGDSFPFQGQQEAFQIKLVGMPQIPNQRGVVGGHCTFQDLNGRLNHGAPMSVGEAEQRLFFTDVPGDSYKIDVRNAKFPNGPTGTECVGVLTRVE